MCGILEQPSPPNLIMLVISCFHEIVSHNLIATLKNREMFSSTNPFEGLLNFFLSFPEPAYTTKTDRGSPPPSVNTVKVFDSALW